MDEFINHNGNFLPAEQPIITSRNRAFRYGDALFESVRITNSQPQFLKDHFNRLLVGMQVLKFEKHKSFTEEFLKNSIQELASKNKIETDARVRIVLYRNDGGLYAPEENSFSYLIEMNPMEESGYVLNEKGLTVELFNDFKKQANPLSAVKSANSILYVLAGIYKNQHKLDECILLNDKHNIIEAISSNIFAVKNGVLYTPPVADGCVDGVMRKKIIEIAIRNKIAVYEISVMQNVLLGADELFLTNAINGIRWVSNYKQKKYSNETTRKLLAKLNEFVLK